MVILRRRFSILPILLFQLLSIRLFAQENESSQVDLELLKTEGIAILSEYLQYDTSNPPGNESDAIEFLASILEGEGIEFEILESAPHRKNLIARLKSRREKPAMILLHHVDVVPAANEIWEVDPFGGEIQDGFIWGRGAMDMKGLGVIHLMAFLALNRNPSLRERDVILLATADEERGGLLGINWLVENHFDRIQDAEFALNEGGMNLIREERIAYVGIEVTQKTPLWVRLTVHGQSGHGSVPRSDSVNNRLIQALNRILAWETEVRVEPIVDRYFKSIAPFHQEPLRSLLLSDLTPDQEGFTPLQEDANFLILGPYLQALVRNTISLTVLESGSITNVIPATASAELDCRLLPGEDPEAFLNRLRERIQDPAVEIEVILKFPSSHAPIESSIFNTVRKVAVELAPGAAVGISVLPGFTDSHILREKGIAAYGFSPFQIEETEPTGVHSQNERISVQDFRFGLELFYGVVAELVYGGSTMDVQR